MRTKAEIRESNRLYMRSLRKRWREAGLCGRCGKRPPRPDKSMCQECYAKCHAAYLQAKAEGRVTAFRRRQEGVCTNCGGKHLATQTLCTKCRDKKRRHHLIKRHGLEIAKFRERDGNKCRLCGSSHRLHVHHIDGQGEKPGQVPNHHPSNLITLCVFCHHALTVLRRSEVDKDLAIELLLAQPID